jgi:hypothetical protein
VKKLETYLNFQNEYIDDVTQILINGEPQSFIFQTVAIPDPMSILWPSLVVINRFLMLGSDQPDTSQNA